MAFFIAVELNVAPLTVSTSADCAKMMDGMISSAIARYAPSSFSADVMSTDDIFPASIVTLTSTFPPKPSALPVFVPSLDQEATIVSLPDKKGNVMIQSGIIKLSIHPSQLEKSKEAVKKAEVKVNMMVKIFFPYLNQLNRN